MKEINLDYAAAAPLDREVVEAMLPYLTESYGNPSSGHRLGAGPRRAMNEARENVARLVSAQPEQITFTSCASEANNAVIKGVAAAFKKKGNHIISSATEHFSVINPLRTLQKEGYEVTLLPVDHSGSLDPDRLAQSITPRTILISLAAANHEIGTVQEISLLSGIGKSKGILFHTDATAAAGWVPLDVEEMGVDLLTLAGDQFYGPKGSGALYARQGVRILPLLEGGTQEHGRRAGTENVAILVGMGVAAKKALEDMQHRVTYVSRLRDQLQEGLFNKIAHLRLNGHANRRLPHNLHVSVEFVEGEALLLHLDMAGIYISSGSSCASEALKSSHVLAAIGQSPETAQGSLRFMLGKDNRPEEIPRVISEMERVVQTLRQMSPLYHNFLKKGRE